MITLLKTYYQGPDMYTDKKTSQDFVTEKEAIEEADKIISSYGLSRDDNIADAAARLGAEYVYVNGAVTLIVKIREHKPRYFLDITYPRNLGYKLEYYHKQDAYHRMREMIAEKDDDPEIITEYIDNDRYTHRYGMTLEIKDA